MNTRINRIKHRLYQILEKSQKNDIPSLLCDIFIYSLILLNIAFTMLETLNTIDERIISLFKYFEIFSVIIFTIEYILRLWTITCNKRYKQTFKGRIKYIFSFLALVDLIALLPFYLSLIIRLPLPCFRAPDKDFNLLFLRAMRLFRMMRILKISRYSHALASIVRVLKRKAEELWLTIFVVIILLVISSSIMYFAEQDTQKTQVVQKAQENIKTKESNNIHKVKKIQETTKEKSKTEFKTIFHAFWWGIVTLTTVGYGDMAPKTALGRILGGIISLLGVGLVAIPSGIFASAFQEDLSERKHGKIRKLKLEGHIVICGYNQTARVVLELIQEQQIINRDIVLITPQSNPNLKDIIFLHGDYSDLNILQNASVDKAYMCIVFSEEEDGDTNETIDMRTIFTVYNIKKENSGVHTIAELIYKNKLNMLKQTIESDEIILTEMLDSRLIATSIIHLHIFPVLNELINLEGKVLHGMTPKEMGYSVKELTYEEILAYGVENDFVFIGYISKDKKKAFLSPANDKIVAQEDSVIYIE